MRPLPAAVVGTFVLGLALAGPAAAQTVETPLPTSTATATAAPTATATATAAPTATAEPTGEPTSLPTETELPGEEGEIALSEIKLSPGSGPAGTTIALSDPADACLTEDGEPGLVELALLDDSFLDTPEGEPIDETDLVPADYKTLKADAEGDWSSSLKVPADAENDSIYFVWAACYAPDAVVSVDEASEDPFILYDSELFVVTDAPLAAPAKPVAGQPSFTG